jgi:hypothetical protein
MLNFIQCSIEQRSEVGDQRSEVRGPIKDQNFTA